MDTKRLTIVLLVLALFTGATIEISEGSVYNGIVLFLAAMILFTRLPLAGFTSLKYSKLYLLAGLFIVIADAIYNFSTNNSLGTLDTMVFFLGLSLVALGLENQQIQRLGEFGAYISSIFIVLFLIFYILFGKLNIDFLHVFDHYFILLPTVKVLEIIGIPVEVIATETVRLQGIEDMTIVIGGPCSGLYSMFLLIGIVFGYSRIEKLDYKMSLFILGLSIFIAYISNLFRVVVLYLTAYFYGQETMMMVHTHLGWIIFAVIAAAIIRFIELKK